MPQERKCTRNTPGPLKGQNKLKGLHYSPKSCLDLKCPLKVTHRKTLVGVWFTSQDGGAVRGRGQCKAAGSQKALAQMGTAGLGSLLFPPVTPRPRQEFALPHTATTMCCLATAAKQQGSAVISDWDLQNSHFCE